MPLAPGHDFGVVAPEMLRGPSTGFSVGEARRPIVFWGFMAALAPVAAANLGAAALFARMALAESPVYWLPAIVLGGAGVLIVVFLAALIKARRRWYVIAREAVASQRFGT